MMNKVHILIISAIILLIVSCNYEENPNTGKFYYENGNLRSYRWLGTTDNEVCGIFYRKNGSKEKEYCQINGKFNGSYIEYYSDGTTPKNIINYKRGVVDGSSVTFFPNYDTSDVRSYQNGKKVGIWRKYKTNNKLKAINKYVDDQIVYMALYDSDEVRYYDTYYPLIEFNKDSLNIGDTLSVEFKIIDFLHTKNIMYENWTVIYDFSPTKDNYGYPELKSKFGDDLKATGRIIVEDTSLNYLHGSLLSVENEDTILYEIFSREVFVY